MLLLSKDFVHYCRRSRSVQVHNFTAALTCLRSVETNLTVTCPSPKSFVCNLPDSGRHVTSVFQGLSLSLFLSLRRSGRREPSERGWSLSTFFVVDHVLSARVSSEWSVNPWVSGARKVSFFPWGTPSMEERFKDYVNLFPGPNKVSPEWRCPLK